MYKAYFYRVVRVLVIFEAFYKEQCDISMSSFTLVQSKHFDPAFNFVI